MTKLKPVKTRYQRSYIYPDQLRSTREDAFWRFHAKHAYWGTLIPQVLFAAWADNRRSLKLKEIRKLAENLVNKNPALKDALPPIPRRFMSLYGHLFVKWYPGYQEVIKPLKPVTLGPVKEEEKTNGRKTKGGDIK